MVPQKPLQPIFKNCKYLFSNNHYINSSSLFSKNAPNNVHDIFRSFISDNVKRGLGGFFLFSIFVFKKKKDYQRYKLDKEVNKKSAYVFEYESQSFLPCLWQDVKVGDIIKVKKDEPFPCDLLMIRCSDSNGICFVDTMNLDGETNLKEKIVLKEFHGLEENILYNLKGVCDCDAPNEYIERFDATLLASDINEKKAVIVE